MWTNLVHLNRHLYRTGAIPCWVVLSISTAGHVPIFPSKLPLPMGNLDPHLIRGSFLGPTRILNLNDILIGSALFRPHRGTTYVDAACCYLPSSMVCRSVSLSDTLVSPAKTAEPIEMPFGLWARMGRRNRVRREGVQRCWGTLPWQPILRPKLL